MSKTGISRTAATETFQSFGVGGFCYVSRRQEDRLKMLQMVLRASEAQLKDPPTPDVAHKIVVLVEAWLPFAAQFPYLKERLDTLKATAMLFV